MLDDLFGTLEDVFDSDNEFDSDLTQDDLYMDLNDDDGMDTFISDTEYDLDSGAETFTDTEYDLDSGTETFTDTEYDLDSDAETFTDTDADFDDIVDHEEVYDDSDEIDDLFGIDDDSMDHVDQDTDSSVIEGYPAEGYVDNFDPNDSDAEGVIGDPGEAMDSWHVQESNDTCAVAAQEFVLEELTGQNFEESDLRDLAEENGWYSPDGGTLMDDVGNILEHMGLQVERSYGNTIEDLEQCLENDGEVIVGLDSSEVWYGEDDDVFGPGMDADHAVQVIGIDRSDPENPMVILNDSGVSNGAGALVPLDTFKDAWEDSDCFMVEAYA